MFSFLKNVMNKRHYKRLEDVVTTIHLGFYARLTKALENKYDEEAAGLIAAGLSNMIINLGDAGEKAAADHSLRSKIEEELKNVSTYMDSPDDPQSITFACTAYASMVQAPLADFTAHMSVLARNNIAAVGSSAPDMRLELRYPDLHYYVAIENMNL